MKILKLFIPALNTYLRTRLLIHCENKENLQSRFKREGLSQDSALENFANRRRTEAEDRYKRKWSRLIYFAVVLLDTQDRARVRFRNVTEISTKVLEGGQVERRQHQCEIFYFLLSLFDEECMRDRGIAFFMNHQRTDRGKIS